jgi:hypothetical protein
MKRRGVPLLVLACVGAVVATAVARGRPALTHFSLSPARFAVPATSPAGTRPARVATIRFRLSERATVTISFARRRTGRRPIGAGRLVLRRVAAGRRAVAFDGRVGGRALVPGIYRATIVAVDRAHRRSARRSTRFTVLAAGPATFPTPATTGVPAEWKPAQTHTTDLTVTQPGAVVQDVLLLNADLHIAAPNVTVRRVKLEGGRIENRPGAACENGLLIEDSSFEPPPGQTTIAESEGAVGTGGYTARRVKIWRRSEGFRVGGHSAGCGPVRIERSFAKIVIPPGRCDLHADGIQGYDGPALTIADTTVDFTDADCGTAPLFVPSDQGNTSLTVDGLLLDGGGFPFRMGVPGTVAGLRIVDRSWGYGPIAVTCSLVRGWDARVVTTTPDYRVVRTGRRVPCDTSTS